MVVVVRCRDGIRVLIVIEDPTLAVYARELVVVVFGTVLVECAGSTFWRPKPRELVKRKSKTRWLEQVELTETMSIITDALLICVDSCDLRVHATKSVSSRTVDEAGAVVGILSEGPVVGGGFGLEITLEGKRIDSAFVASVTEGTGDSRP